MDNEKESEDPYKDIRVLSLHCTYGQTYPTSSRAFWQGSLRADSKLHGKLFQDQVETSFSSHNILLAAALNSIEANNIPITHIALLHNDVVPENGWIDILLEEMIRTDCDLLGAVSPIKDFNGLSSTAIDSHDNPFLVHRRITMEEIYRLPETFDNVDCGYPDRRLLVNTSCILMNFSRAWRDEVDENGILKLNFAGYDRVARNDDGKWMAHHAPSDWHISREITRLGGKVMATRKVKLKHMGHFPFSNEHPWGEWPTDKALEHVHKNQHIGSPIGEKPSAGITIQVGE
jgi:hypothetical protein